MEYSGFGGIFQTSGKPSRVGDSRILPSSPLWNSWPIEVSPNPAHSGEQVTITGHCGSAGPAQAIFTANGKPFDGPVRIVDQNSQGFRAEARIEEGIGAGGSPVYVDCGSAQGETTLVTQP